LGPQLPHQEPSPQVQGQSSDHPVTPGMDTMSATNNVVPDGWVTVESRCKASRQSYRNSKGKEVVVADPMLDVNTCVSRSPPTCVRDVWSASPPRPETLVEHNCVANIRSASPPEIKT